MINKQDYQGSENQLAKFNIIIMKLLQLITRSSAILHLVGIYIHIIMYNYYNNNDDKLTSYVVDFKNYSI